MTPGLIVAGAASAVKRVARSIREPIQDRFDSWRYDPPPRTASSLLRLVLFAVVALALFGWWMHRQGYLAREGDFKSQQAALQSGVLERDAKDNAAEAANIAKLRDELALARARERQALEALRRGVLEPAAAGAVTSDDLNATIRRVSP